MKKKILCTSLALALAAPLHAAEGDDIAQLRRDVAAMKAGYEARISALEKRLEAAEAKGKATEAAANAATATANQAATMANQVATVPAATTPSETPAPVASGAPSNNNSFNPEISLILSGIYTNTQRDPANYAITGFPVGSGAEIGPGKRGFSLAESELGIAANIDPYFRGALNFSMHPDNSVSVEEAYIQTLGLGYGLTVKAGRFYSGIGYLNQQHSHTWDFVDSPLAYQAFLGGQFGDDGVEVRWLAPTDLYLELGAELGRGADWPGNGAGGNGPGTQAVHAHLGGDIGNSNSWRAGLSYLRAKANQLDLAMPDTSGDTVASAFTGDTQLAIADFVWKWAPNGNATRQNFKLQGEYLWRKQNGVLGFDTPDAASDYRSYQSGWYLQGVYQFMPYWRVGVRSERLSPGAINYGPNDANLAASDYVPRRNSLMFDFSPSEFSRIRFQYNRDSARQDQPDNQFFLQYQMSLGAHGAHIF
ncbi:MAG: porin [Betaproteobacteria bacterium]|nr:porin [Betaproteobacteria bacterium]